MSLMNLLILIRADPKLPLEVVEVVRDFVAEAVDVVFPLQKETAQQFPQWTQVFFALVGGRFVLLVLLLVA